VTVREACSPSTPIIHVLRAFKDHEVTYVASNNIKSRAIVKSIGVKVSPILFASIVNKPGRWELIPMGIRAIPILIQVVSHSFPFPFPILSPILSRCRY